MAPVLASSNSSDALPIISIAATADTPRVAIRLARRETNALITYIQQQQVDAKIPETNRVILDVVSQARSAALLKGRSLTLPVVVFLSTMLGVVGLAFLLENLRPRPRSEEEAKPVPLSRASSVA